MERVATELARHDVATLRYQFPYMDAGWKIPDTMPVAIAAVRAALDAARQYAGDLDLFAGGKSFGGRMTSHAVAGEDPGPLQGLVFLGFPLHPANQPGTDRARHLDQVPVPLLFLQGTRDALSDLDLLRPVIHSLGKRATLHVVHGGDHSFKVPKRSGRNDTEVLQELGEVVARWMAGATRPAEPGNRGPE